MKVFFVGIEEKYIENTKSATNICISEENRIEQKKVFQGDRSA